MNTDGAPGPVIDAHHHVWDLSARAQPWLDQDGLGPLRRNFTMADLEPEAAAADVTATVVVQTVTEPGEAPDLLSLAAGHHLIAGVVGWVDLASPGVADAISALLERPGGHYLAGIRHPLLVEPDAGWLARPQVLRGPAAVAAAGLTYGVVCTPPQLPAAVAAAAALPQLTFVLGHLGNPEGDEPDDGPWAGAVRTLAALPNTVAKLSGVLSAAFPGRGGVGTARRGCDLASGRAVVHPYRGRSRWLARAGRSLGTGQLPGMCYCDIVAITRRLGAAQPQGGDDGRRERPHG